MRKCCFIILILFIVVNQGFSQSGKLQKAKQSLNTSSTTTTKSVKSSKRNSKKVSSSTSNPFARLLVSIALYSTYGILIETPLERGGRMHDAEIAQYPYKEARYGNFIYTDSINYSIGRFDISNSFVVEDKNLYGNNLNLDFRFFKRMGFEVDYLQLFEKNNGISDSFSLFSAMINYHRIRTQKLDIWFGLGVMYVGNDVKKAGFSYGFGAEWFIKKPISLLISHKSATINNRGVNKTKLVLKYHLKNYHVSTGYENFVLAVSSIDAFSVGVGVSF